MADRGMSLISSKNQQAPMQSAVATLEEAQSVEEAVRGTETLNFALTYVYLLFNSPKQGRQSLAGLCWHRNRAGAPVPQALPPEPPN
jgi:hypothetical protein